MIYDDARQALDAWLVNLARGSADGPYSAKWDPNKDGFDVLNRRGAPVGFVSRALAEQGVPSDFLIFDADESKSAG